MGLSLPVVYIWTSQYRFSFWDDSSSLGSLAVFPVSESRENEQDSGFCWVKGLPALRIMHVLLKHWNMPQGLQIEEGIGSNVLPVSRASRQLLAYFR